MVKQHKKESPVSARFRYDRQNREAAEIILADPRRCAGLPLEWATLYVKMAAGKYAKKPAA